MRIPEGETRTTMPAGLYIPDDWELCGSCGMPIASENLRRIGGGRYCLSCLARDRMRRWNSLTVGAEE